MKRLFLLYFVSCLFIQITAQQNVSNILKLKLYNHSLNTGKFDILVKGDLKQLRASEKQFGIRIKYSEGDIACAEINSEGIEKLSKCSYIKFIEYNEPPASSITVMSDSVLRMNKIYPVKKGHPPLKKSYDGTGVIIGIIDTGIDLFHPDFKDNNGQTRIKFLWDQKRVPGPESPLPFSYGEEWDAEQINSGECNHRDTLQNGHGTYVAGIAAGNGTANKEYEGCAANAELIVVALDLKRPGASFADAVKYIAAKAEQEGKPFVINISAGNYYGSHDAKDLQSQLIENIISNKPGRALVAAAGNAGGKRIHAKYRGANADTSFIWIKTPEPVIDHFLYADTASMKTLQIAIGANTAGFADLGRLSFHNYQSVLSSVRRDTLKYKSRRIGIVQTSASINGSLCEFCIRIIPDTLGYLWRIESAGKGGYDSWNLNFLSDHLPSRKSFPGKRKYILPDTVETIVSGFQCSNEVITIGNYIYSDSNDNKQVKSSNAKRSTGGISKTSSIGPTRDGRIKPDITATGDGIISCASSLNRNNDQVSAPINDKNYCIGNGTSAASAIVAGMVALYLQMKPLSTNRQIKDALTKTTSGDLYTGSNFPNLIWGYGKLDGLKMMIHFEKTH